MSHQGMASVAQRDVSGDAEATIESKIGPIRWMVRIFSD